MKSGSKTVTFQLPGACKECLSLPSTKLKARQQGAVGRGRLDSIWSDANSSRGPLWAVEKRGKAHDKVCKTDANRAQNIKIAKKTAISQGTCSSPTSPSALGGLPSPILMWALSAMVFALAIGQGTVCPQPRPDPTCGVRVLFHMPPVMPVPGGGAPPPRHAEVKHTPVPSPLIFSQHNATHILRPQLSGLLPPSTPILPQGCVLCYCCPAPDMLFIRPREPAPPLSLWLGEVYGAGCSNSCANCVQGTGRRTLTAWLV